MIVFKRIPVAFVAMASFILAATSWSAQQTAKAAAITRLDLGGAWQVSVSGSNDWFDARVPGCVHTDLLAAKRIPDPFFGDNESRVQWVGEKEWTYRRTFDVPSTLLSREQVLLHCEGLDTLATLSVNGVQVGQADNMFRTWEYNVKGVLKPGANIIEIKFASVLPLIRAKEAELHLPTWAYPGAAYVRKMPCNFGWDWGPTLITCGIWRDISLVAFDHALIDNVLVLQDHSQANKVKLTLSVEARPSTKLPLKAEMIVTSPDSKVLDRVECPLENGKGSAAVTISRPRLWWPAGMGAQPLYTVQFQLKEGKNVLDATTRRIGLRTMEVLQQTNSTPMQFVVNGVPFFAKGANWIPADAFPTRSTPEILRSFMQGAVAANMNSIRFWGGGYYEDDVLFEACDELGLCIWMDCKFGCSTYPAFDGAFLKNVRQEMEEQVKRLRHHPSIALWCGNNEIMFFRGKETWTTNKMSAPDYYRLFDDTIGGVVRALAPQTAYVTGSPDCGDVHYWDVWHGGKPFEAYRDIHGFVSEFGFQSFPVPATVNAFTQEKDRTNVYSPIVKYHMRSNRMFMGEPEDGTIGTDKIMKIVRMNFREPKDFESTLWLSQINQAYGIEFAAEGWRREMPRSMGCVFWQYNDDWPGTSWSSVDYFGRWKALQYRARHFYAPILVSGDVTASNDTVAVWLTSDEMKAVDGKLGWKVTDLSGKELLKGNKRVTVAPRKSGCVESLELGNLVKQHGKTNLLVWLSFDGKGKQVSQNLVLLAKPRHLNLPEPDLTTKISGAGKDYTVTVHARHPALWVWLEVPGVDAVLSDNFVSVEGGGTFQFTVKLSKPMSKKDLAGLLRVRSLFDTYEERAKK